MKYNIRGSKIDVTDAIKEYTLEKLDRLNKYFKEADLVNANVLFRVRNREQIVEVTIYYDKFMLRSEVAREDLYASIDLVVDKLERQIRKNKTQLQKQNNSCKILNLEFDGEIEEEDKIVKRKVVETKPMSEEEAILQMELLGHDFYVFKDLNSNVAVVYKRKDKDVGIIEVK